MIAFTFFFFELLLLDSSLLLPFHNLAERTILKLSCNTLHDRNINSTLKFYTKIKLQRKELARK